MACCEPISVDDEDVTVDILRQLIAEGYKGDELIDEYCKVKEDHLGQVSHRRSGKRRYGGGAVLALHP